MKRTDLIYLIQEYNISKDDALFLKKIFENLDNINVKNFDIFRKKIEDLILKTDNDEVIFHGYEILNKLDIVTYSSDFINFNDDISNSFEIDDFILSEKEIKNISKVENYIDTNSVEQIKKELLEYIFIKNPDFYKKIHRGNVSKFALKFLKSKGSNDIYNFKEKIIQKWESVYSDIQYQADMKKYNYDLNKIDEYKEEYLKWADEKNILKHTKQNIKNYFKLNNIIVNEQIFDELKNRLK